MSEHITIGDIAPRVQYVADGIQADFTFPFPIFVEEDLELRVDGVPLQGGFEVLGAGLSEGGTLRFVEPPLPGTRLTLRRRLRISRNTDFQDNAILRASALNDELDYQVAALQDVAADVTDTLRFDPAEGSSDATLPLRGARANRVLGFDSVGAITLFDRNSTLLTAPFTGAIPTTVEDKLSQSLSVRDFGAVGDGVTDDTPALQAAMNAAAAAGRFLVIGEGSHRATQPLVLPGAAAGLIMRGAIIYAGPAGTTALTIGDGNATRNATKFYHGLRVIRAAISDWTNEGDIGLVLRNMDATQIEIRQVEGFTIGIRTLGEERGFEDSTLQLGRIVNNKIGLDIHTATAAAWNTSVRYYGGHFAIASSLHPTLDRYGVRFSAAPGAYVAHNRHIFDAPGFELQAEGRPISGIPFLCEVSSRAVWARALRMEGCSPFVARHTGPAQDHVYEVAWASQAYNVSVDYVAASRVGAVVRTYHQGAAFREATRTIANVPCLRAARIRWSNTEWGFEKLACLSSNVAGSPTALAGYAFPALSGFTFTDRGVILTGGRGLGFVADARSCREFALVIDADDPRLVVQCFDANMTLLTDASGTMVTASGQALIWNGAAKWWQGNVDMTDADLTRRQVIRLAPQVAFAIIGAARIGRDYEVRAMALACDPGFAPSVLFGQPDLPHGARELTAEQPWDPPSIAADGTTQFNLPLTGARPGDFASASFSQATSGVVFLAQVGATDVVTVTAWNRSGAAIDLGAGIVRGRVVKA